MPPEAGPGRPPVARLVESRVDKPRKDLSRGWLYFLALVALGALVIPVVRERRDLSPRERMLIIALGCLQTLAALVVGALFVVWLLGRMRGEMRAM
jgi:hypothetical protein